MLPNSFYRNTKMDVF